jgi:hypothetical protein
LSNDATFSRRGRSMSSPPRTAWSRLGLPIVSAVQVPSQAPSESQCGKPPGGSNEPCASCIVSWTSVGRVACSSCAVPTLRGGHASGYVTGVGSHHSFLPSPFLHNSCQFAERRGGKGERRERPFAVCPPQVTDLLTASRRQPDLSPHTDEEEGVIVRS